MLHLLQTIEWWPSGKCAFLHQLMPSRSDRWVHWTTVQACYLRWWHIARRSSAWTYMWRVCSLKWEADPGSQFLVGSYAIETIPFQRIWALWNPNGTCFRSHFRCSNLHTVIIYFYVKICCFFLSSDYLHHLWPSLLGPHTKGAHSV